MAIVLKYGAPGSILAAGYAAGVGHRQQEQQDDALKLWQQQQQQGFQAQQADLYRQQQANLQFNALNQQAKQAQLGREFQEQQQQNAFGFQSTQAGRQREFQAGQQESLLAARERESELDRQARLDLETQDGLRRGQLELPGPAKAELDKLEAGLVASEASDEYTPEEKQEFRDKYEKRKLALTRLARPKKEMPYEERLQQAKESIPEEHRGLPWVLTKDNELSLPTGFKMPTDQQAKSEKNFNESVMRQYEKNLAEKDSLDPDKPLYEDENAALQAAIDSQNAIERGRQRLLGRGAQQPQVPTTPAANPVGSPSQPNPQVLPQGQATQAAPAGQSPGSDEFNRKWSSLKAGESIVGPDGKIYVKKAM